MPQLGETVAEGKILAWFKKEGDEIREGDNLFEIETDKVTMEVQSTVAGELSDIRVKAGESAKVGAVVALIRNAAQLQDQDASKLEQSAASERPVPGVPTRFPFEEVMTPIRSYGSAKGSLGLAMTPLARRLIAQNGLDPDSIARSVRADGRSKIAERDVRAALNGAEVTALLSPISPAPASTPRASATSPERTVLTLNTIRKRTGERLTQNWQTIPHVFQAIEVDFTKLDSVRSGRKDAFKAQNGISLTYLPFIARATCIALKEFPQVNAQFSQDGLALATEINLGIAIDLSHDGLVVPVIRNADDMTLPGLAKAIGRQIDKARKGKLTSADFAGGTYSISNNGAFGTSFTAPIINAPQVAILSTDAIRLKPAVIETPQGAFVAPRLMGMVGQSFDHRAFDGAYSAAFLSRLKCILEERDWAAEFA
jgi:pyruvate/2-oxoglutarate dehydrogenase complex dihydrolipoamide acyltransferase (E2) component